MATKRERETRKRREVVADEWLAKSDTGAGKLAITPPPIPRFKEKPGKTYRLSFIPYDVGEGNPFKKKGDYHTERTYYTHAQIGPNKDTVLCAASIFKKPCAVCDVRTKLYATQDKDDEELAKKLGTKTRQMWLVFDHDEPEKGVQFWEISEWAFGKHLKEKLGRARPEVKDRLMRFADPVKGMIVQIGTSEKPAGTGKYTDCADIEFKKRTEPLPDELFEHGICLDDLVGECPKYKTVAALLTPGGGEDDEDEVKSEDDGDLQDEDEESGEGDDESDDEDNEPDDVDEDSDEDLDSDEDEPLKKGDRVSALRKGVRVFGVIGSINHKNGVAAVILSKGKPAIAIDIDKLTKAGPVKGSKPADDEDDAPPAKKPKTKKPVVEDDDFDDDEDNDTFDDDDEDDAPPPAKKPKKPVEKAPAKKPKKKAEDDFDDDDDDIPF